MSLVLEEGRCFGDRRATICIVILMRTMLLVLTDRMKSCLFAKMDERYH